MKKYVKPDVLFEDFEMSVGVAACTGVIIGSDGKVKEYGTDGAGYSEIIAELGLFSSGACQLDWKDESLSDGDYGYLGGNGIFFGSV